MGSASSRMGANPSFTQPNTTTSSSPHLAGASHPNQNDMAHCTDSGLDPQSGPLMMQPRAIPSDRKGKGKQKEAQQEKEEGEISEEEDWRDTRIREIDSWKPPSSSSIYRPAGTVLPRGAPQHSPHRQESLTGSGPSSRTPGGPASPTHHAPPSFRSASPNSARRVSAVSTATVTSATIESPPSDSLSLPSGVNSDETEQYMDIIRNLILSGIAPEALIKRGATRKYITAVCKEIVEDTKRQSAKWTEIRESDDKGTPETTLPVAGPSRLPPGLRSPSPEAVDMSRGSSNASHSSLEINDEIDRMLSPPQPQKLVPSSSWAPSRSSEGVSRSVPNVRTVSYAPAAQATDLDLMPGASRPSLAPSGSASNPSRPSGLSKTFPRPISSYVPTGPRAVTSVEADRTTAPVFAPQQISSSTQTSIESAANVAELSMSMSETLAERKKRVLESMKRGRKPKPLSSGPSTGTVTPDLIVEDSSPTPPILAHTPKLASKATLQDEVAALEREVMQLQENRPPVQVEPEEGEILVSNTPSPVTLSQSLPAAASSKSTSLSNGSRLNRATKRPHAEDLMDGRSISSKPTYPAKRKFGRPIGWAKLQVSLDDSDDDDAPAKLHSAVAAPVDAERAKLEEDIRLLKAQIEQRRLAKAAKVKAVEAASATPPSTSENKVEPVQNGDTVMRETWKPEASATTVSTPVLTDTNDNGLLPPEISTPPNMVVANPEKSESEPASPVSDGVVLTPATTLDTPTSAFAFQEYRPLLSRYPLLPTPSNLQSSFSRFAMPSSTTSLSRLDQRLLSSIVLTRAIKKDAKAVICSAEAAGGICANPFCSDLHLVKLLGQPDEAALLEYLIQVAGSKTSRDDLVDAFAMAKKSFGPQIKKESGKDPAGQGGTSASYSLQLAEQLVIKVGQLLPASDQ